MRLLTFLAAAALLAGCIGGADEPLQSASATNETAAPSAPAAASRPAATPSASPSAATPAGEPEAEAAAPVVVPYTWTSSLPPEVCAPTVLGCAGLLARSGWFDIPALDGTPQRATLELTWETGTGGAAAMRFALVRAKACEGDGCWSGEAIHDVSGASPLAIDVEVPKLASDEFLVVAARAASMVPEPLYGYAHTEQAFDVAGSFTVRP